MGIAGKFQDLVVEMDLGSPLVGGKHERGFLAGFEMDLALVHFGPPEAERVKNHLGDFGFGARGKGAVAAGRGLAVQRMVGMIVGLGSGGDEQLHPPIVARGLLGAAAALALALVAGSVSAAVPVDFVLTAVLAVSVGIAVLVLVAVDRKTREVWVSRSRAAAMGLDPSGVTTGVKRRNRISKRMNTR